MFVTSLLLACYSLQFFSKTSYSFALLECSKKPLKLWNFSVIWATPKW